MSDSIVSKTVEADGLAPFVPAYKVRVRRFAAPESGLRHRAPRLGLDALEPELEQPELPDLAVEWSQLFVGLVEQPEHRAPLEQAAIARGLGEQGVADQLEEERPASPAIRYSGWTKASISECGRSKNASA